jgi:hypothetical protein
MFYSIPLKHGTEVQNKLFSRVIFEFSVQKTGLKKEILMPDFFRILDYML